MKIKIRMTPKEVFNAIVVFIIGLVVFLSTVWMVGITSFYQGTAEGFMKNKRPMIIISESMEPAIATNGLVVVERLPYKDIDVGDIIVIGTAEHGLVSHRVHHRNGEDIITKGDNNPEVDDWVVRERGYKGKVTEINNKVAPILTMVFGTGFKDGSIPRVYAGFLMIALVISAIIVGTYYIYDFTVTNYFLKKAYKEGAVSIYCEWMQLRVSEKELEKQIGRSLEETGLRRIVERYKVVRMYQILEKEAKYVKKSSKKRSVSVGEVGQI